MNEREIIKEIQSYIKLKIFDRIRTKGKKSKKRKYFKDIVEIQLKQKIR
jgi:hypothetical protein